MCSNLSLPHLLLSIMAGALEGMFYAKRNVSILFYTKSFILAVDLILPFTGMFLATSEWGIGIFLPAYIRKAG